ncbi:MAG TPA: FHA domain-containing protein [Acidimicrobiia bacterium]|nr:FHA domain-containing protein [Acidimicrobiia bacterium]
MSDDRHLDDDVELEHEPTVTWRPDGITEDEPDREATLGTFAWALTIEKGPRTGLTYVLSPGNTVAGRSGDCDIFLADVTVSREHARFSVDAHGLSMTDLGSTNGTYVNGRRHEAGRLFEGDELLIGKFHLRVAKGHG